MIANKKRSQAEAFGLILIVGLVFVVFIIMIRIESTRSPSDVARQYEVTALSSSTVNTFLGTVTQDCGSGKTFSDVAIDCMRNPPSTCGNLDMTNCNYLVNNIDGIFSIVFDRANLEYEVRFASEGRTLPDELDRIIGSPASECTEGLSGEEFRLPLNPGELTINLAVCRP